MASPSPPEIVAPTGIGGVLAVSGDRATTLLLDREVLEDAYSLAGDDGRIFFEGSPAVVSRIQIGGLSFYLDPGDCERRVGELDDATGLAPLEVRCTGISDVRDTAVVTIEGTLRLPADQLGVRGDVPSTGGTVTVGDEMLTFAQASLDLRRPDILETGPNSFVRNPSVYPISMSGDDSTLHFEYDSNTSHIRLLQVDISGVEGQVVEDDCQIVTRQVGQLSPRVTVAEMTLECPAVVIAGVRSVPLSGTLIVDIAEVPASGLR